MLFIILCNNLGNFLLSIPDTYSLSQTPYSQKQGQMAKGVSSIARNQTLERPK